MQTKLCEISPHTLEWLVSKRQEIANVGKVGEKERLCTVGENVN